MSVVLIPLSYILYDPVGVYLVLLFLFFEITGCVVPDFELTGCVVPVFELTRVVPVFLN